MNLRLASGDLRAGTVHGALALAATLLFVYTLNHEYRGLVYDAQIYAVEALAKLRPSLAADLFLKNTSQAQFTIFPQVYAWCIDWMGLRPAALVLTASCTLWLLGAAWRLSAILVGRELAWLCAFALVVAGGRYGAANVFQIVEPYLTARLPAEALIATACYCYFAGFKRAAFLTAIAALFIHPLMGLPGILLLVSLHVPRRIALAGAATAMVGCLLMALAASKLSSTVGILAVMDASWLEVVRQRSQFLFLQLWTRNDWALNAIPFLNLVLAAQIVRDERIRRLAFAALLVGATGLAIAGVAGGIGPTAILVQGQAWRWIWVTTFVSILMLVPAAREAWRDETCGPLCAALMVAALAAPPVWGLACEVIALLLWALRSRMPGWLSRQRGRAAAAVGVSLVAWAFLESWHTMPGLSRTLSVAARTLFASKVRSLALVALLLIFLRLSRSPIYATAISLVLSAAATFLLFTPSSRINPYGSDANIREFADWRARIPAGSSVYVTNGYDSGSFVWFTLQRNNYLSPGQSAGVVFSRDTALEVRRRSDVLLPVAVPNWEIMTSLRHSAGRRSHRDSSANVGSYYRNLTADGLRDICRDATLGFVVSPHDVGVDGIPHEQAGPWSTWKLYDCNHVRSAPRVVDPSAVS